MQATSLLPFMFISFFPKKVDLSAVGEIKSCFEMNWGVFFSPSFAMSSSSFSSYGIYIFFFLSVERPLVENKPSRRSIDQSVISFSSCLFLDASSYDGMCVKQVQVDLTSLIKRRQNSFFLSPTSFCHFGKLPLFNFSAPCSRNFVAVEQISRH